MLTSPPSRRSFLGAWGPGERFSVDTPYTTDATVLTIKTFIRRIITRYLPTFVQSTLAATGIDIGIPCANDSKCHSLSTHHDAGQIPRTLVLQASQSFASKELPLSFVAERWSFEKSYSSLIRTTRQESRKYRSLGEGLDVSQLTLLRSAAHHTPFVRQLACLAASHHGRTNTKYRIDSAEDIGRPGQEDIYPINHQ